METNLSHCEFKPHCCYEENALKNVIFFNNCKETRNFRNNKKKTKEPSINKSDIFNDYVNAHGFYEAVELGHLSLKKVIICEIVISIADNKQKQPNSSSLREQILKSLVLYQQDINS